MLQIGHKSELLLDTLDATDLLMQFKVMKALGYKSLFDPDFRREMRNPFRRLVYYKLVIAEEDMDKKFLFDVLRMTSDRISFFSDPELYRKVKDRESQRELMDADVYHRRVTEETKKFEDAKRSYVPMTDKDREILGLKVNKDPNG